MIFPTMPIKLVKKTGANVYGEPQFGPPVSGEKCSPVRLRFTSANTTVRTDSAGTRGHAMEDVAEIRILVPPKSAVRVDDHLILMGQRVRVVGREPRFSVTGKLDHYEVICDQKVSQKWE